MKIDVSIGDIIFTGKWKNKKEVIKKFGTDDHGQPTVNGRKILSFRMEKFMETKKENYKTMKRTELRKIIVEVVKEIQVINEKDNKTLTLSELLKLVIKGDSNFVQGKKVDKTIAQKMLSLYKLMGSEGKRNFDKSTMARMLKSFAEWL